MCRVRTIVAAAVLVLWPPAAPVTAGETWQATQPARPVAQNPDLCESRWELARPPGTPADRIGLRLLALCDEATRGSAVSSRGGQEAAPQRHGSYAAAPVALLPVVVGGSPDPPLVVGGSPDPPTRGAAPQRPSPSGAAPLALLYLPGTHMNGELAVLDEGHAFRLYLARRHVPVWSLDYRTHFVAPDTEGLKFMRGWSSEVFLGDAIEALDFVLEKGKQTGMGKVVVAGFSRGATFAYVLGERRTASVAGLVILDGVAPGALGDMGSRQRDQPAIDIGSRRLPYPKRKVLLEAVVANPKTPSTDPEHPTVGDHLGHILFTSRTFGGRGGLSAAREGRASIRTVAQLLLSYDRYWPTATTGFGDAAALVQRTDRPVFALASTNIGTRFTEAVVSSARAAAGPAATVVVLDGYGHLDVLVGRDVRKRAFEPLVAWLRQFDLRRTPAPAS